MKIFAAVKRKCPTQSKQREGYRARSLAALKAAATEKFWQRDPQHMDKAIVAHAFEIARRAIQVLPLPLP